MSIKYRRTLPDPEFTYSFTSLRAFYTGAVLNTARSTADKKVVEIKRWMKANAPWQDRPAMFVPSQKGGYIKKPAANARKHLDAYVNYTFGKDDAVYRAEKKQAKAENKAMLRSINRKREKANLVKFATLPDEYSRYVPAPRETAKGPTIDVVLTHGSRQQVPYAVWLEIAKGGRYAIIGPAIEYWAPKLMRSIQLLINTRKITDRDRASFMPEVLKATTSEDRDFDIQATNVIKPGIRRPKAKARRLRKLPKLDSIR